MNNYNEIYLNILDQLPNPIWRSGLDAKCDFFNKAWLTFTGRTMDMEVGDGWVKGVHTDDLKKCVDEYTKAFFERKSFKLRYRLKNNDGTYHHILDFGSPFYDLENNFSGFIGSCYDEDNKLLNNIVS